MDSASARSASNCGASATLIGETKRFRKRLHAKSSGTLLDHAAIIAARRSSKNAARPVRTRIVPAPRGSPVGRSEICPIRGGNPRQASPVGSFRITGRLDDGRTLTMKSSRLAALAIARALRDGPRTVDGLTQRLRDCLARWHAEWADLVARCSRIPETQWSRLTDRTLADWVERDAAWRHICVESGLPAVRRWILREADDMAPITPALEGCAVPYWPHTGALAQWLGVSTGGLWRLSLPAAWQRRRPLVEQHYRCRLHPKPSGGWRLLEVPEPWLRALQRRILDDLLDRIPPHEAARAYVRERSVLDHARAHVGQPVLLKFDLRDFFATVRASRVHATFRAFGYSDEVARTLAALCTTATPEPVLERLRREGGLGWTQAQALRDPHLPQGAPSSAALANLCAFDFDVRVAAFARQLGARYTRYADDIVLSGGEALRSARSRIEARLGAIAIEEGFALNHRKTRCLSRARRQQVCGIVVNAGLNLPRAEYDRLKAILHGCLRHGPASQNREGLAHWREHLRGRVAWARQLNAAKAERLQRLFEQIVWDQVGERQSAAERTDPRP